jgi:hypothetical protein
MEKRDRNRLVMTAFCRVAPVGNQRRAMWKRIENISGAGLLVEWSRGQSDAPEPKIGEAFMVELQLPAHPVFGERALQYKAKIVRVSRRNTGSVMAGLQTTQTRFRSLRPGTWQKSSDTALVQ